VGKIAKEEDAKSYLLIPVFHDVSPVAVGNSNVISRYLSWPFCWLSTSQYEVWVKSSSPKCLCLWFFNSTHQHLQL